MIQLKDAQSMPQIILRDAASQSGSVLMGDGKVLFSVPSEKYVFSPSMLFADGEVGSWYDPSDSATLFQEAAGTTPAGIGDPVGLMLDKSQFGGKTIASFLAAQSELLGSTDNEAELMRNLQGNTVLGTRGVVSRSADFASSGLYSCKFLGNVTTSGAHYINLGNVDAGVTVKVTGFAYVPSGSIAELKAVDTSDGSLITTLVTSKDQWVPFEIIRPAKTTSWPLALGNNTSEVINGTAFYLDNVSVKELPGNHATQSTSNARPTLQEDGNGNQYLSFDGVDDYLRAPFPSILYQPISYGLAVNFGGGTQFAIDGHGANAMSLASVSGIRLYSSGAGFSAPMSLGANSVVLSRGNGAASAIRVNGSEVSGVIGAGAIAAITLGSAGSLTLPLNGRIYQAVILGGLFGGSDRSLESYLAMKSGVVL